MSRPKPDQRISWLVVPAFGHAGRADTERMHPSKGTQRYSMVNWYWAGNVLYFEYEPLTIEYDQRFDAFTIARADLHTPDRRFCLTLTVVVTGIELGLERLALETAIERARALLLRLVDQHRLDADRLTASTSRTFNLHGEHVR